MNEEGYILTEKQKILNINIARCYHEWYTKSERKFRNSYEKDLFYLCAAMVTDKYDEFKKCLSKINTRLSIKEMIEEVSTNMEKKDELRLEYYNFMDETKRINDGILEEVKEKAEERGKEIGKKETIKETIVNMKKDNLSLEVIAKYVNLPIKEVEEIINNQE